MNIKICAPDNGDREALRGLWKEAFGDGDAFLDLFEVTAFSPDRARALFCDGVLSAALYWFDCECGGEKLAYLYAISTAKAARGRGLCRALMEDTHSHLKSLGYSAALLVPSSESLFGFYERLGYRVATKVSEFSCLAESGPIELVRIDGEEYAKLRREWLPEGGVVQEGENMRFLSAQAELYRGEKILLAARNEKDALIGAELFGNVEAAPRIVRALGAEKGVFRTVGSDRDFSMIYPLDPLKAPPLTYFGLAFD